MLEILTSDSEIAEGRRQLKAWGASLYPSRARQLWCRAQRRLGIPGALLWPDMAKSWDVSKSVALIRSRVSLEEPILDLGCFNSEVLWSLMRLGYCNLAGCDLDPRCLKGPFSDQIRYSIQDLTHTSFHSRSFKAITCISVIEHGVDVELFVLEASRLLVPGGYLILSTDYWPERIDTSGATPFGLPWHIFSRTDLEDFLELAERRGLQPVGPLNWREPTPLIAWHDRQYSFAWLALKSSKN